MYKKTMIFVLSLVFILLFSIGVSAIDNFNEIAKENEILLLSDSIISWANSHASSEGVRKEFTTSDIQFEDAIKIYTEQIFDLEKNDKQTVKEALNNSEYIWKIPLNCTEKNIVVTISYDEINSTWKVTSISFDNVSNMTYVDYINRLIQYSDENYEDYEIFFAGFHPSVIYPVGYVLTDKVEKLIFTENVGIRGITNNLDIASIEESVVYDYETISDMFENMEFENNPNSDDGGIIVKKSNHLIYYILLIFVLLSGVAILTRRNRNKK